MFINDRGKKYTYAYTKGPKWIKITYPEDQIRPGNILLSFYKLEKLTSVQVSIPGSYTLAPGRLSVSRSPIQKIKLD